MTISDGVNIRGKRVLVVEDEFLIAEDLTFQLQELGAEVLGPAATVEQALAILHSRIAVDGATLDVNLGQEKSFPVAEALIERHVPFVILTGYDAHALPDHLRDIPRATKPFEPGRLVRSLFRG